MPRDRSRERTGVRDREYDRYERDRPRDYDRDDRRGKKRRSPDVGDEDKERKRRRHSRERDDKDRRKDDDRVHIKRGEDRGDEDREKRRKRDKSPSERKAKAAKHREEEDESARKRAEELSAYSTVDNPFNDANLGEKFKWHKKAEKEKKMGMSASEAAHRDALRREEAKEELERLNKRRAEREAELRVREEEETRMQRFAESAQMDEWIAKEGDFQLEQERKRAGIRLKEKRAKAIDFLALNLKYAGGDQGEDEEFDLDEAGVEIDFDEPYKIFENLTFEQTEELHDDILKYLGLEKNDVNIDYWTCLMVVCKDQLGKLQLQQDPNRAASKIVESDVTALLSGKTYEQLILLQRQIQGKLSSGEPVDTDYWEGLLESLLVWKAKAKLREIHAVVVKNRLEELRKRQRDEAVQAQKELLAGVKAEKIGWAGTRAEVAEAPKAEAEAQPEEEEKPEPYDRAMSPTLVDPNRLKFEERQIPILDEKEDKRLLFAKRHAVTLSQFIAKAPRPVASAPTREQASTADIESEALYREAASKELDEEEEEFNWEEIIALPTTYSWEDRYRPRKPRYFNRVHTGYEWNKYNQTHYDVDNPPPKVVQGYKFNIFYPDLIDKSKAPTYKIIKDPKDEETLLLVFQAGPPYEDIAFRIVNREWEYSHKRGFRSSFDRGCLSLWFSFRRNFYRK
ncbi:hypothetical protein CALVIDRAFT_544201 [Calocera viscosa TUFC12733]|uniref:Splicing factor Cactin n=1 Tax=Calocera viscosa (strain TUFC12733) TaxID=1330018 RepID=A0A167QKP4_CALVF|nr:hypothetical protein CALVIDRAFT_544201 [Calocera viscosa TUFC12733]